MPFKIYFDNVKHFTVNIPRPEKPYIVLNPIEREKAKIKTYHLISFKEKVNLTMGRKKDADIVIDEDSSISRYHSSIEYEKDKDGKKGRVYLSDKDSKFGTLVLLKKSVNLSGNLSGLALQFGGSIAIFQFKSNNPIGNGDG